MSEYNYFVSYKWRSKDSTGHIEGYGYIDIHRDTPVRNMDDIAEMKQFIERQSDLGKLSHAFNAIILNWRRFEDNMDMETCICAAWKTTCGLVVRGHRHVHCLEAIEHKGKEPDIDAQGFVTSTGRFVTREEGYELQVKAGIESIAEGGYRDKRLFSEDLY